MQQAPPVYNEKQAPQQTGQGGQQPQGYPPQQQGYPPQQPGYPAQQQGYPPNTTQTTVVTQPAMVTPMIIAFHEAPLNITCATCRNQVVTVVRYDNGTLSWLLCVVLCLLGFWLCCCIPLCIPGCQDVIHSCPNCHAQLGVYRRM